MYIPKHYMGKEGKEAISFMQRFNFGTMITSIQNIPIATHLPFVITQQGEDIIITSHLAKANEHSKHIENCENLIIFTEPHAYISPSHYEKQENVPTWNYIAIHAYGKARIISDPSEVMQVMESMIEDFEPSYKKQWNSLSEEYKSKMAKGVVAFEIKVSRLQYKEKLSQNKKESERKSIIQSLSQSENTQEKTIAEYMKSNEQKNNP